MKTDVIPAQRRKLILDLIRQEGILSVHEIASVIGVSLPTIRRDLDWLAKAGSIERSHGGALIKEFTSTTYEPGHQISTDLAKDEKARIGAVAVARLRDHQSVIFDSSTTVYQAAQLTAQKKLQLTAVTNDLRIGELFTDCPTIRLIVCGGTLRPFSHTLIGESCATFLQQLRVDVAIMGIHALNEATCYDTSLEVSYIKRYMVQAAKKVLLLVDSSKFGEVAFFEAFTLDEKVEVITDCPPPAAMARSIRRQGARITCESTCNGNTYPKKHKISEKEKRN